MKLSVNGEFREVNSATLDQWVVSEFGANNIKGMAIAVNDSVVPSSKWVSHALKAGDKILVVEAAQGG